MTLRLGSDLVVRPAAGIIPLYGDQLAVPRSAFVLTYPFPILDVDVIGLHCFCMSRMSR